MYTTPGAIEGYSAGLSMVGVPNAGDQAERMLRRALILLLGEKADAGVNVVTQVRQTPANSLQDLDALITDYALRADQITGAGHSMMAELNRLKAHPIQVLQERALICFGYNQFGSGLQNVRSSKFYYNFKSDSFLIKDGITYSDPMLPRAPAFPAVVIPAIPWVDVSGRGTQMNSAGFGSIRGVELTGADFMVTTQFSRCSFCFKEVQGRVFAAHISPAPNNDPDGLNNPTGQTMNATELAKQLAGVVNSVTGGDFAVPAKTGPQNLLENCHFPSTRPIRVRTA